MSLPQSKVMRTVGELVQGFNPTYHQCTPSTLVSGLCTDTRKLKPGDLFVALRGATFDGHNFLDAVNRGQASLAIVARNHVAAPQLAHICLDSPEEAMPTLAGRYYGWPNEDLLLSGITGTNGKTTTSHLLGSIFQHAGYAHARIGTSGNWIVDCEEPAELTTPFPLELQSVFSTAVHKGASHAIMEVSSHALEQARVAGLKFHCVAMTSFSQDHLDYHGGLSAYLAAKCRLSGQYLSPGGFAVAAIDEQSEALDFLRQVQTPSTTLRVSKGQHRDAEIYCRSWEQDSSGIRADVRTPWGNLAIRSPLIGSYNLDNLLVAAALALAQDIKAEQVGEGLAQAFGAPGRMERVALDTGIAPTVYVDYSHTPDAIKRALASLRQTTAGRLIVVLGCGGDRDRSKRPQMAAIASQGADLFFATSDNPRNETPGKILDDMLEGCSHCTNVVRLVERDKAIQRAIMEARSEDTVLIAGKGHEDYQVIGTTKIHFDDREHARSALLAWLRAQP